MNPTPDGLSPRSTRRGRPRATSTRDDPCARCGRNIPRLAARWPEGRLCFTCYNTAIHTHGTCPNCRQDRLLPGTLAGRHLHPTTVANRLRGLGINLRGARNRALAELVVECPPSLVADALGYSHQVAFRHASKTAEPWARYVGYPVASRNRPPWRHSGPQHPKTGNVTRFRCFPNGVRTNAGVAVDEQNPADELGGTKPHGALAEADGKTPDPGA